MWEVYLVHVRSPEFCHFPICCSVTSSRQMRADPRPHQVDVIYIHDPVAVDIVNDVVGQGPGIIDQHHVVTGNIAVVTDIPR